MLFGHAKENPILKLTKFYIAKQLDCNVSLKVSNTLQFFIFFIETFKNKIQISNFIYALHTF